MGDLQEQKQKGKESNFDFANHINSSVEKCKIGDILRRARRQAGLTQQELAEKMNTKKSAISRIENHSDKIRLSTLYNYTEALGYRDLLDEALKPLTDAKNIMNMSSGDSVFKAMNESMKTSSLISQSATQAYDIPYSQCVTQAMESTLPSTKNINQTLEAIFSQNKVSNELMKLSSYERILNDMHAGVMGITESLTSNTINEAVGRANNPAMKLVDDAMRVADNPAMKLANSAMELANNPVMKLIDDAMKLADNPAMRLANSAMELAINPAMKLANSAMELAINPAMRLVDDAMRVADNPAMKLVDDAMRVADNPAMKLGNSAILTNNSLINHVIKPVWESEQIKTAALLESIAPNETVEPIRIHKNYFEPPINQNLASEFYKRLVNKINLFNESLDDEYEVGVRLINFGQTITFHLQDMDYLNPSLITFLGETETNERVELIQHISQISILLMKLRRKDPSQPKHPFGFTIPDDNPNS